MAQRHKDALNIQNGGACNLSGIALTLVEACKEVREEGGKSSNDAAVRLIVHQMASLTFVYQFDTLSFYQDAMQECEERKNT